MKKAKNIILIGMPGAGKSSVGVVLAKKMGYRFVDSDIVIQEKYDKLLYELIEEYGIEGFWQIENDVNARMEYNRTVIATGGSAIYGKEAMEHFREIGEVIYLSLSYEEVVNRLGDLNARGVTLREGQTLESLYEERIPYYEAYAHRTIDCNQKGLREIVLSIASL
ncbi:shikimate kinase [Lachnospiraceae bacterium OttesenSCG-928-D06]|nr:shikimate kinase [Lachnospiraceae bacterium OttesenSCG-928-D06]